jgi:hypothetical protein
VEEHRSLRRFCMAMCEILVKTEDERVIGGRGDSAGDGTLVGTAGLSSAGMRCQNS